MRTLAAVFAILLPVQEEGFNLPPGFRIYQYAAPSVAPGGYSIAFDGEGRLYVGGEGTILRLIDRDKDGRAEASEPIAEGLGKRCPQGLLVVGDRIYAAGAQRLYIISGGERRPIGGPLKGGGDHGTHALVRGLDGHLYFAVGNGAGAKTSFITEPASPSPRVEGATIFRIHPEGEKWEAYGTGGRNFYGFAMNELGEIFLVDSDGEWHHGLPEYGPVRLWHSPPGADRGWRDHAGEGCWPAYWPDVTPALQVLGRGSPTAAVFYEHTQFPERYRGSFLSGDYMWKRVDNNTHAYVSSGRINAFRLKPRGAGYEVEHSETFALSRDGGPGFAVLDLAVAPDGSLLVTGHGQGVWRIYYDPDQKGPGPLVPAWPDREPLEEILTLPQPEEEWSRAREEVLRARLPAGALSGAALDGRRSLAQRLRAIRLLAPRFAELEEEFMAKLATDREAAVRAQAAWLLGLRGGLERLEALARDPDPLVRRRALEGLARHGAAFPIEALADDHRAVRHAAMLALRRRGPERALAHPDVRIRTAALVVAGRYAETEREALLPALSKAIEEGKASKDPAFVLEVLRAVQLHLALVPDPRALGDWLSALLGSDDYRLVREASRLAGRLKLGACVPALVGALERAEDSAQQFHLMKVIAPIEAGWTPELEARVVRWLDRSDTGEMSETRGKGVFWPNFWREIVATFAGRHPEAVVRGIEGYSLAGAFGGVAVDLAIDRRAVGRDKAQELRKRREERSRQRSGVKEAHVGRLRTNEEIRKFLLSDEAKGGDRKRGEQVFQRASCFTCHVAGGGGRVLGPDLAQSLKGKPLDYVVESVLEPSAKIDPKYRSYVVVTKDDQFLQGFLSEETADEVVLVEATRPLRIARKSIDRMRASDLSAMPDGLVNRLTWEELKDLLAFLQAP